MSSQRTAFAVPVAELAASLLARAEVGPRAQAIANEVSELLPDTAVAVYVVVDQENPLWTAKATSGEITVSEEVEFEAGVLGALAEKRSLLVFETGKKLQREMYAHLDIRRRVVALAYVPLITNDTLVGAIELVQCEQAFPAPMLSAVQEIAELAAPAIAAALSYEGERNSNLQSISRVAQMYDLEKVFNSTLEMEELLGTIATKFQEVMNVQAVNLWMVNGDALELMESAGPDPTIPVGTVQAEGEGIAGDISESGEPVLIDDPQDERLQRRNQGVEEGSGLFSIVAAPLLEHETLVGVVEAINRLDGAPFDEDDQFLLTNICETASNALHNASLLQAERKVEILQALVQVSGEITSTLNLDRVLEAVVNRPGAVIPYEQAAIALEQRGRLQLKAVSGRNEINAGDVEMKRLKDMLEWASISNEEIFVTLRDDKIDSDREETRAKFQEYFAQTGRHAFFSLPLADDDGRVGILAFESSDPDFLTPAHIEMIHIIAGQATVALRNASLYKEVPLISVLEPLLERKRKFLALEKRRRTLFTAIAVGAVLVLTFLPIPMRVDGAAAVAPARLAQIRPQFGGVVNKVYVHEGQHVEAGDVLADLADWNYRDALAAAQAKYAIANAEMNRALAANDGTEAGTQHAQVAYWASEVDRAKQRLEATHLRTPISGWVTTPRVEDLVGTQLSPGDRFAEVADTSRSTVDVAIDEEEVNLLHSGRWGDVKLDAFPTRTFQGMVEVVSPVSEAKGDGRVFYARLAIPNHDGLLHSGMLGRAKISVGWHPVGYVLFRRIGMWAYGKLWSWFGWW